MTSTPCARGGGSKPSFPSGPGVRTLSPATRNDIRRARGLDGLNTGRRVARYAPYAHRGPGFLYTATDWIWSEFKYQHSLIHAQHRAWMDDSWGVTARIQRTARRRQSLRLLYVPSFPGAQIPLRTRLRIAPTQVAPAAAESGREPIIPRLGHANEPTAVDPHTQRQASGLRVARGRAEQIQPIALCMGCGEPVAPSGSRRAPRSAYAPGNAARSLRPSTASRM